MLKRSKLTAPPAAGPAASAALFHFILLRSFSRGWISWVWTGSAFGWGGRGATSDPQEEESVTAGLHRSASSPPVHRTGPERGEFYTMKKIHKSSFLSAHLKNFLWYPLFKSLFFFFFSLQDILNHIIGDIEIFMGKVGAIEAKNGKKQRKKKKGKGNSVLRSSNVHKMHLCTHFILYFIWFEVWTPCLLTRNSQNVFVKSKVASICWFVSLFTHSPFIHFTHSLCSFTH